MEQQSQQSVVVKISSCKTYLYRRLGALDRLIGASFRHFVNRKIFNKSNGISLEVSLKTIAIEMRISQRRQTSQQGPPPCAVSTTRHHSLDRVLKRENAVTVFAVVCQSFLRTVVESEDTALLSVFVKMFHTSAFFFVLAGLCVCQAKVVDLTSANFDTVSKQFL